MTSKIKDFYKVSTKTGSVPLHLRPVHCLPTGESQCYRLMQGDYSGIEMPVAGLEEETRYKRHDFMNTGWLLYMISDHAVEAFTESGLTGWKTFPVQIKAKKGGFVTGYQGLSVTGRCGPVDHSKSEPFEKLYPGGVYTDYLGLHVGLDEWDGSDFFLPRGFAGPILSSRAVDVIRSEKLSNVECTRLDECVIPGIVIDAMTNPGCPDVPG